LQTNSNEKKPIEIH